jgi:hypothetical protein
MQKLIDVESFDGIFNRYAKLTLLGWEATDLNDSDVIFLAIIKTS